MGWIPIRNASSDWRIMSLIDDMEPSTGIFVSQFKAKTRIVFYQDGIYELYLVVEKNTGPDLLGNPRWEAVECPIELRPIIRYHFEQFLQNYAANLPGERSEADGSS
jgi:hypothetical protein